jgi:murein DD-endopeptidase MepM/ murein hydrolase activator NlpD
MRERLAAAAGLTIVLVFAPAGAQSLRVEPASVTVGGLAVVRTDAALSSGTFDGLALRFFTVRGVSLALVGVDLDRAPGRYPIEIEARDRTRLRAELEVVPRQFPEERLTVPKAYVEPDRATLARIQREQRLLAGLWSKTAAEPYWRGTFLPPADGSPGSAFGLRRFFNGEPRSPHAGIDFRAPEGAPVRASNRGRVVLARDLFFTGNTVVIDHGCGLFTLYVHLSELGVHRGESVDRGQEIGKVGRTGRATGPHLHFAVRLGDARIDPAALLSRDPGVVPGGES